MATRQKIIRYYFPELAAVTDNTDTNFTQINIYIPETVVAFRSVMLKCLIQDAAITSNNVARRQLSMALGASAYTAINNANLLTSSGEQKWLPFNGDFTALFTASWTGTTMTCDARVLVDSAATSPILSCATACLEVTYDYNDTATTQIKSVRIPLKAPITALATTKPAVIDTIPNLDTYLPEASKVFRQYTIVVEGNEESAATTDHALRWEVDTLGIYSPANHEQALNTASWYRHTQNQSFTTNATHSWYIWATTTDYDHPHVYLDITYEYNESTSTEIFNSVLLPFFNVHSGAGNNTSYQRSKIEYYVPEPATIAIKQSAVMMYWEQNAPEAGLQIRVNAGAWSGAYSSVATTVAGSCAAMHRCETAISLARGKNTITIDHYISSAGSTRTSNFCGFLLLNYTSGKHTLGSGAHSKTVIHKVYDDTLTSAAQQVVTTGLLNGPSLPETDYTMACAAVVLEHMLNSTATEKSQYVAVERLASTESGLEWLSIITGFSTIDSLTGKRITIDCALKALKRYPTDPDASKLVVATARRWLMNCGEATATQVWRYVGMYITYHSITWSVAASITNSAGGTVTLNLIRASDGKLLKTTTRVGNGAFSFSWYDNIENLYVDAWESNVLLGRSAVGPAV